MSTPGQELLLEGHAPFLAQAVRMVAEARLELALMSQELEVRTWCSEAFVDALRAFVLQHERTRVRVLIAHPRQAIAGGSRLVELGRRLSSFVEFRELAPERRQFIREEYLIADGRAMLYRETPADLESRYFGATPQAARLKLQDFDILWNESTTAQELRDLKL